MAKPPAIRVAPSAARTIATAGGGRSNMLMWMQGLLCGGLVALLPPTALLLGPALLALCLDGQPGKPVARGVLLCSLAACVTPVRVLWGAGQTMAASVALASNPNTLGTAWSAAAAGWLLAELIPLGVRMVLETLSLAQAARLRTVRAALAAEWGLDGAGEPPSPPG